MTSVILNNRSSLRRRLFFKNTDEGGFFFSFFKNNNLTNTVLKPGRPCLEVEFNDSHLNSLRENRNQIHSNRDGKASFKIVLNMVLT